MGKKKKANIETEIKNIKKAIVECRETLYFLSNLDQTKRTIFKTEEEKQRLIYLQERIKQKQNIGGIL